MYTSLERSINAKKQLRDKYGKWIFMGGRAKWFDALANLWRAGKVVNIGDNDISIRENATGQVHKVPRASVEAIPAKATLGKQTATNYAGGKVDPIEGKPGTYTLTTSKANTGDYIDASELKPGDRVYGSVTPATGKPVSPTPTYSKKASINAPETTNADGTVWTYTGKDSLGYPQWVSDAGVKSAGPKVGGLYIKESDSIDNKIAKLNDSLTADPGSETSTDVEEDDAWQQKKDLVSSRWKDISSKLSDLNPSITDMPGHEPLADKPEMLKATPNNSHVEEIVNSLKDVLSKIQQPETPAFTLAEDRGKNGDGYHANGSWGKYGASGVLIAAPGEDGKPRYLLTQSGPGYSTGKQQWQLAGGAIDEKETPYQGAARETIEELAATEDYIHSLEPVGEVVFDKGDGWKYTNITARAPEMFEPKVDGTETQDAKWFTKEEILDLANNDKLHPALAKNINDIFATYDPQGDTDIEIDVLEDEPMPMRDEPVKAHLDAFEDEPLASWEKELLYDTQYYEGADANDKESKFFIDAPVGTVIHEENTGKYGPNPFFFRKSDEDAWDIYSVKQGQKTGVFSDADMADESDVANYKLTVTDPENWPEASSTTAPPTTLDTKQDLANLPVGTKINMPGVTPEGRYLEKQPGDTWKASWLPEDDEYGISSTDMLFGASKIAHTKWEVLEEAKPPEQPYVETPGAASKFGDEIYGSPENFSKLPAGSVLEAISPTYSEISSSDDLKGTYGLHIKQPDGTWKMWVNNQYSSDYPITGEQIASDTNQTQPWAYVGNIGQAPQPQPTKTVPQVGLNGLGTDENGNQFALNNKGQPIRVGDIVLSKQGPGKVEYFQKGGGHSVKVTTPDGKTKFWKTDNLDLGSDADFPQAEQKFQIYTDDAGKQYVKDATGQPVYVGDTVTSTGAKGYTGKVTALKPGGQAVMVLDPADGKSKLRQVTKINKVSEPEPAAATETSDLQKVNSVDELNRAPVGTKMKYSPKYAGAVPTTLIKQEDGSWRNIELAPEESNGLDSKLFGTAIKKGNVQLFPPEQNDTDNSKINSVMELDQLPSGSVVQQTAVNGATYTFTKNPDGTWAEENPWGAGPNALLTSALQPAITAGQLKHIRDTNKPEAPVTQIPISGKVKNTDDLQTAPVGTWIKDSDGDTYQKQDSGKWTMMVSNGDGPPISSTNAVFKHEISAGELEYIDNTVNTPETSPVKEAPGEGDEVFLPKEADTMPAGSVLMTQGDFEQYSEGAELDDVAYWQKQDNGQWLPINGPDYIETMPQNESVDASSIINTYHVYAAYPETDNKTQPTTKTYEQQEKIQSPADLESMPTGSEIISEYTYETEGGWPDSSTPKWKLIKQADGTWQAQYPNGSTGSATYSNYDAYSDFAPYYWSNGTGAPAYSAGDTVPSGTPGKVGSFADFENLPIGSKITFTQTDGTQSQVFTKIASKAWQAEGDNYVQPSGMFQYFADNDKLTVLPADASTAAPVMQNIKSIDDLKSLPIGSVVSIGNKDYTYEKIGDNAWSSNASGSVFENEDFTQSIDANDVFIVSNTTKQPTADDINNAPVGTIISYNFSESESEEWKKIDENKWQSLDDGDTVTNLGLKSAANQGKITWVNTTQQPAPTATSEELQPGQKPTIEQFAQYDPKTGDQVHIDPDWKFSHEYGPSGNATYDSSTDSWVDENGGEHSYGELEGVAEQGLLTFVQSKPEVPATPEIPSGPTGTSKNNKTLNIGDEVSHPVKGVRGKITGIKDTGNGPSHNMVTLQTADGKKHKYQARFLNQTSAATSTSTPKPVKLTGDPDSPLYGTPQPTPPKAPELRTDYVPDWFVPAVKDGHDKSTKNDWNWYQQRINGLIEKGDLTAPSDKNEGKYGPQADVLDYLRVREFITEEQANQVREHLKSVIAQNAPKAEAHAKEMAEYNKTMTEWGKANGKSPSDFTEFPDMSVTPYLGGAANWSQAPVGTPTFNDSLEKIKNSKALAVHGVSIATDAGQIEDLDVRLTRVLDATGQEKLEFKFKLRPGAGDSFLQTLESTQIATKSNGMHLKRTTIDPNTGLVKYSTSDKYTGTGFTYTWTDPDTGASVTFYRDGGTYDSSAVNKTTKLQSSSLHNMFIVHAPTSFSSDDYENLLTKLGVSDNTPATPQAIEQYAKGKLVSVLGGHSDPTKSFTPLEMDSYLAQVEKKWGVTWDQMKFQTDNTGHVRLFLPDATVDKIIATTGFKGAYHSLSSEDAVADMLTSDKPGLLNTLWRWTEGVNTSGMSSEADMNSGGADYIFMHPVAGNSGTNLTPGASSPYGGAVVVHPRAIARRLDVHGNSSDVYGKHHADIDITKFYSNGASEITLKYGIDVSEMWYISVPSHNRQKILDKVKGAGIFQVNGIPIDDFLITSGQKIPAIDAGIWNTDDMPPVTELPSAPEGGIVGP